MILASLETFADTLKAKFALPGTASPEDQLKPVVAKLFEETGAIHSLSVDSRTETHLSEHKVRPDIAIYVDSLICGYIELKAPGFGADAPKLKGKHNKAQWQKLKGIPNLIYTDGREWALYRHGERQGAIIRFSDDPTDAGKSAVTHQPLWAPKGHSTLLSAAGGGKTTAGAMPWLYSLISSNPRKSVLVMDSKDGELAAQAAQMVADMPAPKATLSRPLSPSPSQAVVTL